MNKFSKYTILYKREIVEILEGWLNSERKRGNKINHEESIFFFFSDFLYNCKIL